MTKKGQPPSDRDCLIAQRASWVDSLRDRYKTSYSINLQVNLMFHSFVSIPLICGYQLQ